MIYFDTSAMIRADKLKLQPEGITRSHTLAEFYSTLTGTGVLTVVEGREIKRTVPPTEAARAARETFAKIKFLDLSAPEMFDQLDRAAEQNVQSRNIHDWMHCAAAEKAKCDKIATMNFKDFSLMTDLPLIHPSKQFSGEQST